MKGLTGLLILVATSALAAVSLDFSYDTTAYPTRLESSASSLTFAFSIDGTGTVLLDASTSGGNVALHCNELVDVVPVDASQSFVRVKANTRSGTFRNDGWFEIVPTGTSDDAARIQAALDLLQDGDALKLKGDFFIRDTIYLPSNFTWILDGTLTLADNADEDLDQVGWYEERNDANNNIIDARRRTGITEKPGGAVHIDMSGGIYQGNFAGNPASLRLINFISVTHSYFHDMHFTDVSDDLFTLGPGCTSNKCRNLIGSFSASGNALTDKGDHNQWVDCIAEDCGSDGWTPKCRNSEFYRCIARRNEGPGFGMFCRIDGSGNPDDLGESIDGNRFLDCVAWGNNAAGFSFNVSSTSGEGGTIISNYVEAVCYSNASSGVRFRNTMPNSIVADNEINLVCYGNRGETKDGALSSVAGGLGTDASAAFPASGITGSMVSFDNVQWDVNTGTATNCRITVYHPTGENAPILNQGDSSNRLRVQAFDCTVDPLVEWCMQEYCDLFHQP